SPVNAVSLEIPEGTTVGPFTRYRPCQSCGPHSDRLARDGERGKFSGRLAVCDLDDDIRIRAEIAVRRRSGQLSIPGIEGRPGGLVLHLEVKDIAVGVVRLGNETISRVRDD